MTQQDPTNCDRCGLLPRRQDRGAVMLFLRILRDLRAAYRGTHRRFVAKVSRRGPDECWPWLGFCSAQLERKSRPGTIREPYGKFGFRRNGVKGNILAHRWALFGIAAMTRKEHALHTCDNTLCCNPAHLYAGTQRENLRDAEERKRITRNGGTFARVAPHIGDLMHSTLDTASLDRCFCGLLGPHRRGMPGCAWARLTAIVAEPHPISANDTTGAYQ